MKWLRDLYHNFLVLIHVRPDYRNPDNAPPAFWDREPPHPFKRGEGSLVCVQCGGGRLHAVHKRRGMGDFIAGPLMPTGYTVPGTDGPTTPAQFEAAAAFHKSLDEARLSAGKRQSGLPFPTEE
jgi:hypothetical protein